MQTFNFKNPLVADSQTLAIQAGSLGGHGSVPHAHFPVAHPVGPVASVPVHLGSVEPILVTTGGPVAKAPIARPISGAGSIGVFQIHRNNGLTVNGGPVPFRGRTPAY